jgi:predicted AlkP superfamily phosphohydrolase/phosphomutase
MFVGSLNCDGDKMSKVLLLGVDGATWNIIEPLVNDGKLPTFKKLMEEGVYRNLESTIPPWSIPAWNCISTGKNPGKLGFFSFMSKVQSHYGFKPDFLYSEEVDVWDILNKENKKSILINIPNIHKPIQIKGCVVAGFLYLDRNNLTYPAVLQRELDEVCDEYKIDVYDVDSDEIDYDTVEERFQKTKSELKKFKDENYVEKVNLVLEKRFAAIKYLLKKEWDFSFIVFVALDRIQHKYWYNENVVTDFHIKMDRILGDIIDMVDEETTVFIVSDHGFGPRKNVFNVNDWLIKEGFLELNDQKLPFLKKVLNRVRKNKLPSFFKPFTELISMILFEYFRVKSDYAVIDHSNIDWKKTKLFTQPAREMCGDLYINLKGREINGIVEPSEYEKFRDEVIYFFKNIYHPITKNKINTCIYKKEEIYAGDYLYLAPDLVIKIDDDIQGFETGFGHKNIFSKVEGGDHRTEGIFIAYGKDIDNGKKIEPAKIYDVMPTILHMFDLDIPDNIDGAVMKDIFKSSSFYAKKEIQYTDSYDEHTYNNITINNEEDIKRRLKKLGYI